MSTGLLHIAAGLCGFALAAFALFLNETEECELQNRLEELWVRVDDLSKRSITREAALIQQASKMASEALDRIFGSKLLSLRGAATSVGLSWVSLFLFLYLISDSPVEHSVRLFCIFVIALALSFAPGKLRYLTFSFISIYIYLMIESHYGSKIPNAGRVFRYLFYMIRWEPEFMFVPLVAISGGLACDVLAIFAIRWLLRVSSAVKSIWKLVGLLLLDVCMGFSLVGPVLLIRYNFKAGWREVVANAGMAIAASNLITGLMCALTIALLLLAFLHRLVWPVVSRPIYAAQRRGLLRHPRLITAVSAACFLFAWPQSPVIIALTKLLRLS